MAAAMGGTLGLAMGSVAIAMEETGRWTTEYSLIWLAVALPLVIVPFEYWCWKWVRLQEKRRSD